MSYQRNVTNDKVTDESIFEEFESQELASKWTRFANYILDLIVIQIIIICFGWLLVALNTGELFFTDNRLMDYIITAFFGTIYYSIIETYTNGKSIGKFITNTRVLTLEDETPDFNMILKRSLCRYIPFDALSFIGADSNGWHDSISKTKVIKE